MSKKSKGLYAGKKLQKRRRKSRWLNPKYVRKTLNLKIRSDPLVGTHQAKGIVLKKAQREAKQPNSAMSKCCRVQLIKNGKTITAFMPGDNASKFINEHDEVLIECIGGKKGRAKGDLPGIRWQVIKVNDQSLKALRLGKIERGRR